MMNMKDARTNLNPSLTLAFLIVSVTGMMLFFHIGGGSIHPLHEWMSVVFLILCIVHLSLNWKLLWAYLKHGPITLSFIVIFLLSAVLLLAGGNKDERSVDGRRGPGHAGYQNSGHGK
jgi:hypothetical protein